MIEQQALIETALAHNIPPAVLEAVSRQSPNMGISPSILMSLGQKPKALEKDEPAMLEIAANQLSQSFATHGSWEPAISEYKAGSAAAYQNPNADTGGFVYSVLGRAATNPTMGLQGATGAAMGPGLRALGEHLKGLVDMGGVVSPQILSHFDQTVDHIAPPQVPRETQPSRQGQPTQQLPQHEKPKTAHDPAEVNQFAQQLRGLGIDIGHFTENYGFASGMLRRLSGDGMTLQQYAPIAQQGMGKSEIIDHVRAQPHKTYPEITLGQFSDAYGAAKIHSALYSKRTPQPAEAALFAKANANWAQMGEYYRSDAQQKAAKNA